MCIRDRAKAKHLEPEISEAEIINKLAHHFNRGVQVAVIRQGIKTLEELVLLLTKWENVDGNPEAYSAQTKVNINNTPKQNEYKNKQWKKPDSEHNSSKLGNLAKSRL